MKTLFILLIVLLCSPLSAQLKNGVSAGILSLDGGSFQGELGFTRSIYKNLEFNLRASSNFIDSYSFRTGISYVFFKDKIINPTLGLEYHFAKLNKPGLTPYKKSKTIEIPFGARVNINKNINVYGEAIMPFFPISRITSGYYESDRWIKTLRLGVQYRF